MTVPSTDLITVTRSICAAVVPPSLNDHLGTITTLRKNLISLFLLSGLSIIVQFTQMCFRIAT